MMKKSLLAGFVLALMAIAAFFLLRNETEEKPAAVPAGATSDAAAKSADTPTPTRTIAAPTTAAEAVTPSTAATTPTQAQGVRGTLHAPGGLPVRGARVFLQESAQHDLIGRYQRVSRNLGRPPTAAGTTAEDGTFQLGLSEPPSAPLELWALADGFADLRVAE